MSDSVATYPSTPRQRQFIEAIAKLLNISETELHDEVRSSFGCSYSELNRRDASVLIERLQMRRQQPEVNV